METRDALISFLNEELIQRNEEGCETDEIASELKRIQTVGSEQELLTLIKQLERLAPRPNFPYNEPSDFKEIEHQRLSSSQRRFDISFNDDQLQQKMYGAWLGRCAGCMLGKPIEGWVTREKIRRYLELADAYPLTDYVPELLPHQPGYVLEGQGVVRGKIVCAVRDDDIDYPVLNLEVIEQKGLSFTAEDIAEAWLKRLPYALTYTAERAAYKNLVNGLKPPETARYRNPYREWIGAQIRADVWGYVTPGCPEAAAALAYRDASVSHVKNGIYGEMFVASMIAASFATTDIEKIIHSGLSEIPEKSRLAEMVTDMLEWKRECPTWEDAYQKIMSKYGYYSWVHTINNAAVVLIGLLYGELDFEKTITVSVMCGLDTDCNGATCGSILGIILGANKLPLKWTAPLNDRLETAVFGSSQCRISELAKRTFLVAKRSSSEP